MTDWLAIWTPAEILLELIIILLILTMVVVALVYLRRTPPVPASQGGGLAADAHPMHRHVAHISWDLKFKVTEWDGAAEVMFGYTREEALGRHIAELIVPREWLERLDLVYRKRLARKRDFRHTNHNRTKAGDQILCEWYESTQFDEDGEVIGWSSLAIDITRFDQRLRKMGLAKAAVEENLRKSEETLGFYLETIGGDSWDYQIDTQDLKLSEAWIKRFGYDDHAGARSLDFWVNLVPVEDLARLIVVRDRFLESEEESFHEELRIRTSEDEERWVRVQGKLIERAASGEPHRLVGIVTDVTEYRNSQDEKEELRYELFRAQKMETMGQLTGGMVHDFNNMLASIIGYANLVLDKGKDQLDDKLKDYLQEVTHAGQQAQKLVGNMLTFGRVDATDNEPMSMGYLVRDSVKLLQPALPSSIDLQISIPDRLPAVKTNPVKLTQLLMNLSLNAKDAMNGTGRLQINIDEVTIERRSCDACREMVDGDFVELVVADSGHGISNQLLHHIFEPFFTTKEVGRGTGMGLSMVHKIMKEAGGHILVDSTVGVGTSFRLLFPPFGPYKSSSEVEGTYEDDYRATGSKGHIMVVDDDNSVALYLAEVLKRAGHEVTVKFDSMEALETFRADPFRYDLVLTDQTMPKLTGDLLLQAILSVRSDLPVIICTGYSEQMNEERARNLGARGYLRKPIDLIELTRLIEESLGNYTSIGL